MPDYTGFDPEAAAAQLRLDWNLGCGPVPDLIYVLESRGVRVLSLASGTSFSFWEEGQAFIFLAAGDRAEQRHQLAHELGHLLLHSALGADGHAAAEAEAEQFAARLLLPALSLQARMGDTLQLPQLLDLQELFGVPARIILSTPANAACSATPATAGWCRNWRWNRRRAAPRWPRGCSPWCSRRCAAKTGWIPRGSPTPWGCLPAPCTS